jgi:hypothetical protein
MAQDTTGHKPAMGSSFLRSTDGITYAALADISSIESANFDRDPSDDTLLSSTVEVRSPAVFGKATDCKLSAYFVEGTYTTVKGDWASKTNPLYAKIQYPATGSETTGPTITFQYWTKTLSSGKVEKKSVEKVMYDITLEKTTEPVFTVGS